MDAAENMFQSRVGKTVIYQSSFADMDLFKNRPVKNLSLS